jgi:hypothetical protein
MGMENRQQKHAGLVLHYDKRRYDGGIEIEQIRLIEQQRQQEEASAALEGQLPPSIAVHSVSVEQTTTPTPAPDVQENAPTVSTHRRIQDIFLNGPLSICIGLAGVLTSFLALSVASRTKNQALQAQGRAVLADCSRSICRGFMDTMTIPWQLLKNTKPLSAI